MKGVGESGIWRRGWGPVEKPGFRIFHLS